MFEQWRGFKGTHWTDDVNVRDFIQNNYTSYDGDESFLAGSTEATDKLWGRLQELQKEERAKGGVLDMETEIVSGINAYPPAYIDDELKEMEKVVGLQTDKPLKRAFMPYGGIRMAKWFHRESHTLSSTQETLLRRLRQTLVGEELRIMNSILAQFALYWEYR